MSDLLTRLEFVHTSIPLNAEKDLCWKFANECVDTNLNMYNRRNQKNRNKIMNDIYFGKLAEYGVYKYLRMLKHHCTEPDTEIYKARKKSYDADLKVDHKFDIHVKTQTLVQAEKYGVSWMFQKRDPLIKEPKDNDFIFLTLLDTRSGSFNLLGVANALHIQDLYGDPKIEWLNTKKTLYYIDIKDELKDDINSFF